MRRSPFCFARLLSPFRNQVRNQAGRVDIKRAVSVMLAGVSEITLDVFVPNNRQNCSLVHLKRQAKDNERQARTRRCDLEQDVRFKLFCTDVACRPDPQDEVNL